MVQQNGHLADSDVGFYSGLIESCFSLSQMMFLIPWSRLADRIGRKPVLIGTLSGMAIGQALFGLSTSLSAMIAFRSLSGILSGSGVVVRTAIGDVSTVETRAAAYSWFGFAGNLGMFLGPLVGGALADPARTMPRFFGQVDVLIRHPYALSGLAVAVIIGGSALAAAVGLGETLPEKKLRGHQEEPALSIRQLMACPGVAAGLAIYVHVMLLAFVFAAILPLALYTPIHLGGMACSSAATSVYMAVQGASQALWLLLVFPWLQRRIGTKRVLRLCGLAGPLFYGGFVLMNALLRLDSDVSRRLFWVVGVVVATVGPGVNMAATCAQLVIQEVAPDGRSVGLMNALALTLASAIRSFVPAVSTIVFASGVRSQIIYGYLAWAVLIPLSAALIVMPSLLPDETETN
ncbi:hypothetical protein CDD80_665 [Ophiocordyceps camponoti-rufipedis]|uniref:Major facilitator superfamily (MFS) profile domain-containing protein n=1 Tax=Ophiocordyceps camponoti-rufipedis TaxID=2004952 RepID=A0A2C5YH37_9HYPO|nr:hypothetical protein CDD80_665 [Ophiocordyceps camponoti-rufipedis]